MDGASRRSVLSAIGGIGTAVAAGSARSRRTVQTGGERWTQYGYDDANTGHAPDNTGPGGPVGEVWRFETGGAIRGQPVVVDGTVYFGSTDGTVYALDARDGSERWRVATGAPVQCSPAVADGTVYVGNRGGDVFALTAADGGEKWVFETAGQVEPSLTVAGETVYAPVDDENRSLAAIDSERGTERWSVGRFGTATGPAVVDGTAYIGTGSQDLRAYDAATGTERWQFEAEDFVFTSPVVAGGVVYAGSNDDAGTFYAVEAADGSERWRYETGQIASAFTLAVANGTVFVANDETIDALDAVDGTERWSVTVGDSRVPAVAGGTVYTLTPELVAVDATSGTVEWRSQQDRKLVSPLAVVGGSVYAGSADGIMYRLSADAFSGAGTEPSDRSGTTVGTGTTSRPPETGGTRKPGTQITPSNGDGTATGSAASTTVGGDAPLDPTDGATLPYGLLGALVASGVGVGVGAYWLRGGDSDSGISIRNTHDAPLACKLKCRTSEQVVFEGGTRLDAGETRTLRESLPSDRFEIAVGVRDGPTTAAVFNPAAVAAISITVGPETAEVTAE